MIKKLWPKGEFGRNVLTLMTGTVAAQSIPILASPLLTRMYTPESFGEFGLFTAILGILAIISTGRYELAAMHPASDDESKRIMVLSLCVSSMVSLILAITIGSYGDQIVSLARHKIELDWLVYIPITLFVTSWYQTYSYWLTRKKNYTHLSRNKVMQTGVLTLIQFGAGYAGIGAKGLIFGHIVGWLASLFTISRSTRFEHAHWSTRNVAQTAWAYRSYPLLQAPASLLNTVATQAAVFFLVSAHSTAIVGFYNLTAKVLTAPTAIISKSIGQVYFQRISEITRNSTTGLISEIMHTAVKLLLISIIVFTPLIFFGRELFSLVFGAAWEEAGGYAQILSIAVAVRFVVSPISTIFLATEQVHLGSLWQVLYFFTSMTMFFIAVRYNILTFLWIYTAHEVVLYLLYFLLMLLAARTFSQKKAAVESAV